MAMAHEDTILASTPLPLRRPLRVALVTETYPPEVNGVAATISRVVEGLRERGHPLQLVRPRQAPAQEAAAGLQSGEVLMRGFNIPRYPQLKMGLPARRSLLRLWTAQRPDVVHIVTEGPLGWSALQAATHLKLPVVSDFRTNFHAYSSHYGVGWLRAPVMAYLRSFHNRTQCTMVPTETLRSELAASGFQGLRVVARGVDTQRFTPARRSDHLRAQWGASPNTLVALCVGRLAAEKNLGALIEAAAAMREHQPGMRLVLVGDGPERARMQKHCANAVFAGVRHGDDLAAHYASADLFLFPSMTETFGNVVPEAMASGLAVVAYDHAAAGQLIRHGHNGLLASFDDQPGFCRLARHAVADHAQVRALGLHARTSVLSLDWRHIIDAVESEYAAAIAGVSAFAPAARSAAPCTPPQTDPVRP